jgi:hypothetical protein
MRNGLFQQGLSLFRGFMASICAELIAAAAPVELCRGDCDICGDIARLLRRADTAIAREIPIPIASKGATRLGFTP